MRYENETGNRALGMYVNSEHVDVSKELLIEIIQQIAKNCYNDGFDEICSDDHAVAGFLKLFIDTANETGYHRLQRDLQKLYTHYDIWGSTL
jgi:hypothetical protein